MVGLGAVAGVTYTKRTLPIRGRAFPDAGVAQRQAQIRAQNLARGFATGVVAMETYSLTSQLVDTYAAVGDAIGSKMLRSLAEVFSQPWKDAERRTQIHRQVGVLAQRSVLSSYGQVVTSRRSGPAGYRAGGYGQPGGPWHGRLAGGVLRRALGRDDFFEAGPDGLNFINTRMLDHEAAHWRRLAFGAGPAGTGLSVEYGVEWSGMVVASLGIDVPARPSFTLPRGAWIEGGFYPIGELPAGFEGRVAGPRRTRGITTRPFLNAGIRRIATELPRAWESYYRELWAEFKATGQGYLADVSVRPRPAVQSFRAVRLR